MEPQGKCGGRLHPLLSQKRGDWPDAAFARTFSLLLSVFMGRIETPASVDASGEDVRERAARIAAARHAPICAGGLSPLERIERLLDPGTAFLEIGQFREFPPVTGIGEVEGRLVMILADAPGEVDEDKIVRAQEIATQNHLPCLWLADSGRPVFPGRSFYLRAHMSAKGMAQIAAVMSGAVPALMDQRIVVGESTAGDRIAVDEGHALELLRRAVAALPERSVAPGAPFVPPQAEVATPGDVAALPEIVAHIVDHGTFDPFRPHAGHANLCGFARVEGMRAGIIAAHGAPFGDGARAAADFVALCRTRNMPLLLLQRDGGCGEPDLRLAASIATAPLPKIVIGMGGDGDMLCGRAFAPDFLWRWPGTDSDADGVIVPEDTRTIIALCLTLIQNRANI